jgi:hypothetical protein
VSKTKPKSKTKSSKPKKLIPDITAINLKVGIILLGIFFFVIG